MPLALVVFLLAAAPPAGERGAELRLRAEALDLIHEMNLTPAECQSLEKVADGAAGKVDKPERLGQPLRQALNQLCDALARADEERIGELQDKVDELADKADLDDPWVDITDAAKKKAPDALKLLNAAQLTSLIAVGEGEIAGPAETLIDSLDEVRGGSDEDFKDSAREITDDVVVLANGFDADKSGLGEKVSAYLSRVHKLSDDEFKSKRHDLEEEARKIVGASDAFVVLRHWSEREMAELLSNPELTVALREWQRGHTNSSTKG